jgi:hypothetical protein
LRKCEDFIVERNERLDAERLATPPVDVVPGFAQARTMHHQDKKFRFRKTSDPCCDDDRCGNVEKEFGAFVLARK